MASRWFALTRHLEAQDCQAKRIPGTLVLVTSDSIMLTHAGVYACDCWCAFVGAGFYVNATQSPWSSHYRMYEYVTEVRLLVRVRSVCVSVSAWA